MATLRTRAREIANLEGFDIQFVRYGECVDECVDGFRPYGFDRKLRGTATVAEWKTLRFEHSYPGLECKVFFGDGSEANPDTTLNALRASYEEDQ
jgi:hypothetical protein